MRGRTVVTAEKPPVGSEGSCVVVAVAVVGLFTSVLGELVAPLVTFGVSWLTVAETVKWVDISPAVVF